MRRVLRKVIGIVPTLLLTWTVVFAAMRLIPGDPVLLMLGGTPVSEEAVQAERVRLGVDQPYVIQYVTYIYHAATGNLGDSFSTRQPVTTMIAQQLPYTLQLAGGGLLVGILFGIPLGIAAGLRPNGWIDAVCMTTALAGVSMPSFWIAMLLIEVFATMLGWVPVLGNGLNALILPSISVGMFLVGGLARLLRASVIEVSGQDFVRTAHAKGLSAARIVFRHVMVNAAIPPLTLLGVQFALLIGGAVVTETVFARPGIGALLVRAVLEKDYPLVQGLVIVTTAGYVVINLVIDLAYGWLDPRLSAV